MKSKSKTLVKVVGTVMTGDNTGRLTTKLARGISPLKRGQSMFDFISSFLLERNIKTYALHQRAEKSWSTAPFVELHADPKIVVTYHFVEFPSGELGYHAKDLTTEELDRDMKHLRKIVYG